MINAKLTMCPDTPDSECWDNIQLSLSDEDTNIVRIIRFKNRVSAFELFFDFPLNITGGKNDTKTFTIDQKIYSLNAFEMAVIQDVLKDFIGDYFEYSSIE